MSERRRVSSRDRGPAPADQKVWGPADSRGGYGDTRPGTYGDARSGSYGDPFDASTGRRRAGQGHDGHGQAPAPSREPRRQRPPREEPHEFAPGLPDEGRPRRRGRSEAHADTRLHPAADDEFAAEEPSRRRRRRRDDDEQGYDTRQAAGYDAVYPDDYNGPTAPRRMAGGDGYDPPEDPPRRRRGGGGASRGLGVAGWIGVVMTCVLVIGTLTAYKFYRDTIGLFNRTRSTDDLDKNRPVNATGAINVLLVGSDSRAGANKKYGQHLVNDGERTDTIMLLHVSPNRDGATLLSFPRDSMVMIPSCRNAQNVTVAPHLGMINSAFSDGGMICTRRTIENLTNIPIDHFVKVDFTGFKNIVNALGGIQICLPQAVNDKQSKLNLTAGKHLVKGEEALAYVRLRHGLGDGSDIARIKRQQVFISQVVKKATSTALLTDVGRLREFITAAAQSVTMDDGLNTETLLQIASSASKLSAKGFKATTVPWEPYAADHNRVQWKQPDATNLFNAIRSDTEVTPTAAPTPSGSASAKPSAPTVTKPQQVKVEVFNGTNTPGRGREVAEALAAQGFKVVGVGDARKPDGTDQPKTMVRYTGQGWDYAKVVTGKLLTAVTPGTGKVASGVVTPFTPASPPPDAPKGRVPGPTIQLVVGTDWQGVRVPLQVGDNAVTSDTNICSS
ncbi:LCP family protein [Microbispora sp. ATCC PTA-5024]|uniref:LCP family protein n=1 Tax=Microbispora sp. ATCC PTA-5024 TaxID=316330 RepID=UPI0003DC6E47|nr:LCP family protein [Microbispora sp. ATCC PTA-5024]ETK33491.1 hypothetical protein MPTA5024_24220 [Microbispora sp. ATCC PTA-5024]